MTPEDERTLTHLLDALEDAGEGDMVSIQNILDEIGERSIMPFVLAVSILLVSPLSGIPGFPTVSAIVLILLISQALIGRRHLWLPGLLSQRCVKREHLFTATSWLRRPAAWFDTHSHPRLKVLAHGPMRFLALVFCIVIPMLWPFFELMPFITSFGAGAVALMAFGLLTQDGYFLIAGYAVSLGILATVLSVVQAAT